MNSIAAIFSDYYRSLAACVTRRSTADPDYLNEYLHPQARVIQPHAIDNWCLASCLTDFQHKVAENPERRHPLVDARYYSPRVLTENLHKARLSRVPVFSPGITHLVAYHRFRICAGYLLARQLSIEYRPGQDTAPPRIDDTILAILMARHTRLGRASPLGAIATENIVDHILPALFDGDYLTTFFAPRVSSNDEDPAWDGPRFHWLAHNDTRHCAYDTSVSPTPHLLLRSNSVQLWVGFMDRAKHKVVLTNDTGVDHDAFQQIPDRCLGVLLRASGTARLFLGYGLMIDHFQSVMPRAPPEGGKAITICSWANSMHEIHHNPDAPELPVNFVIDEDPSPYMDTDTITYSSWEELRHELHVGIAAPLVINDVRQGYGDYLQRQTERIDARTRYIQCQIGESIAQMTEVEIENTLEWLEAAINEIVRSIHVFQTRRGLPLLLLEDA